MAPRIAGDEVNPILFGLIERLRKKTERFFLRPVYVDHQNRHYTTHQFHVVAQRVDVLRRRLMVAAEAIQNIPYSGGVQALLHRRKQFFVVVPLCHDETLPLFL